MHKNLKAANSRSAFPSDRRCICVVRSCGYLFAAAAVIVTGCSEPHAHHKSRVAARVQLPDRIAVVFFADGVNAHQLRTMIAADQLPTLKSRFVTGGTIVDHAVTVLPSVTYAATGTLLTGVWPSRHHVTGNRWFDRFSGEMRDYGSASTYQMINRDLAAPTIHELLPDCLSASVQSFAFRGAQIVLDRMAHNGVSYYLGKYEQLDERAVEICDELFEKSNRLGRFPGLIWFYFPATDQTAHGIGPDTDRYEQALMGLDRRIGRIMRRFDESGMSDRVRYHFVSDHGQAAFDDTHRVQLLDWIRDNRDIRWGRGDQGDESLRTRLRRANRWDVTGIIGADRRAAIYLRGEHGWHDRPAFDQVRAFLTAAPSMLDLPAVELALLPTDSLDYVAVLSNDGTANIHRDLSVNPPRYRLEITKGDPLGYLNDAELAAFVNAGWHESREWLEHTAGTHHPDFVPQAAELFDSHRAGDLVLFAADNWSFGEEPHGGHGSCISDDMIVPMMFSGAGVDAGVVLQAARTADLAPTIVEFLRGPEALRRFPRCDGISLESQLRTHSHEAATRESPPPPAD